MSAVFRPGHSQGQCAGIPTTVSVLSGSVPAAAALRLLVVDEAGPRRDLLQHTLQAHGYQICVAAGIPEVLQALARHEIAIVLLDCSAGDQRSLDCLAHIRRSYSADELPILVLTAHADSQQSRQLLQLGASDVLTQAPEADLILSRLITHAQLRQARRALRDSEERYLLAARGSHDGLWDWNLLTGEVYYSPRWKELLGLQDIPLGTSPDEWFSRVHPDDRTRFRDVLLTSPDRLRTHVQCEIRMLHRDGGYRWMLCHGVCVRDAAGQVERMAGSLTDISEARVGDPLTGLPNRLLFVDRLERTIERTRRTGSGCFAVLFLDLDNFKRINDTWGHQAGDLLLVEVARRLELSIRAVDNLSRCECGTTVARHAGDEFTILLESLAGPDDAQGVADRILEMFRTPVVLNSISVVPTFSIGIAVGDQHTRCAEELMRRADTAMYHAKAAGRNRRRAFDERLQQLAGERTVLEQELSHALQSQQFVLHFQPIVQLSTLQITGFETLVRWQHPARGLISPLAFLGTAEEMGLMVPLGWWILEQACRQAAVWQTQFPQLPDITVNVNCSRGQFCQPDFLPRLQETLARSGVGPGRICLELTESTLMDRPDVVEPILQGLQQLGVLISIDDFGTGCSSLPSLYRFPLHALKIDQSFVQALHSAGQNRDIVQTIVDLARRLQLQVVAEGVETEQQWTTLAELGTTHGQGFLFSPPVSATYAARFLSEYLGSLLFTGISHAGLAPLPGIPAGRRIGQSGEQQ